LPASNRSARPTRCSSARRIEFTLTLKRIDDGRVDLLGSAISAGGNILWGLL